MLTRYMHQYQYVYLIKTVHKSLKLFDVMMKLLQVIYIHQQINIVYGFKFRKLYLFWGLTETL